MREEGDQVKQSLITPSSPKIGAFNMLPFGDAGGDLYDIF